MKRISVYQSSDGHTHTSKAKCAAHESRGELAALIHEKVHIAPEQRATLTHLILSNNKAISILARKYNRALKAI